MFMLYIEYIGWCVIALDRLHSVKHVSNGVPVHRLHGYVLQQH